MKKLKIVGVSAATRGGKDTFADFLVEHHGFRKIAFADPIKRAAMDWFEFSYEQLWGPQSLRDKPDIRFTINQGYAKTVAKFRSLGQDEQAEDYAKSAYLSPRKALQIMGTEVGRLCYPRVWIEYAFRVAERLLNDNTLTYAPETGIFCSAIDHQISGVVISDVRFRNEVRAIKEVGGKVVRLLRNKPVEADHESESQMWEIPDNEFDAVFDNSSVSLEGLRAMADDFAVKFMESHK